MPKHRHDWPLTLPALRSAIAEGESTLVEFKGGWWLGSDDARTKAQIARAVMAMANSVSTDEIGLVLVGVDDERRGSTILGVVTPPSAEAIVSVLGGWTHEMTPAIRRYETSPASTPPALFGVQASPVSAEDLLQHVLVKREIGDDPLQACVFLFQLPNVP